MITYSELFQFVMMLCAVITLVIYISRKKQRPCSAKVRRYFLYGFYMPAVRQQLTDSSLVKHIIVSAVLFVKFLLSHMPFQSGTTDNSLILSFFNQIFTQSTQFWTTLVFINRNEPSQKRTARSEKRTTMSDQGKIEKIHNLIRSIKQLLLLN